MADILNFDVKRDTPKKLITGSFLMPQSHFSQKDKRSFKSPEMISLEFIENGKKYFEKGYKLEKSGSCELATKAFWLAEKSFERAVKCNPCLIESDYEIARCWFNVCEKLELWDLCNEIMTSYEQYDYIDEELDRKLARIRKNINNPLFCKSELMKVSELYRNKKDFPHHWAMYTRFARANKNFGNIYGAYKFYKEAARLNPNNYIVNIGLGEVCLIIGNKYENLKPRFYSEANLCFNNLEKNGYQSSNLYSLINNLKTDEEDILID